MKLKIATFIIVGGLTFLGMSSPVFASDLGLHVEVSGGKSVLVADDYASLSSVVSSFWVLGGSDSAGCGFPYSYLCAGVGVSQNASSGIVPGGYSIWTPEANLWNSDLWNDTFSYPYNVILYACSGPGSTFADACSSTSTVATYNYTLTDDHTINGVSDPIVLDNTHLISISPLATTTATTSTLEYTGYLASSDLGSTTSLIASYSSPNCSATAGSAIDAFNGSCNFVLTFPIYSAGNFDISTSTTFQYGGVWNEVVSLQNANAVTCIFGFCFGGSTSLLSQLSGSFTVGSLGAFDIIQTYVASSSQAVAAGVASTSAAVSSLCNPFSGSFNVPTCLYVLVVPSGSDMTTFFSGVSGQFLQYAPWGYVSRFMAIISNNVSTTSLPCLCLTIPSVAPFPQAMWGSSFDFTPWGAFSSSSVLVSTVSPIDGKTFTDIITPYWDFIWGVLVVFAIVFRLLGVPFPSTGDHGSLSDSSSSDDSYRLKEYLYNNRKR
jgi:hypothetical protein